VLGRPAGSKSGPDETLGRGEQQIDRDGQDGGWNGAGEDEPRVIQRERRRDAL
jgi:hypothetical protein